MLKLKNYNSVAQGGKCSQVGHSLDAGPNKNLIFVTGH